VLFQPGQDICEVVDGAGRGADGVGERLEGEGAEVEGETFEGSVGGGGGVDV
jgi:hypothetical protein